MTCDFCGMPIVEGQHYLKLTADGETRGFERPHVVMVTQPLFDGTFCSPVCAGIALARAGQSDPILVGVFQQ